MPPNEHVEELARARAAQLLAFLRAFNEKRSPVIRDVAQHEAMLWWRELPPAPNVYVVVGGREVGDTASTDEVEAEPVLRVERPTIPEAPTPPSRAVAWLKPGWNDPTRDAEWNTVREDADLGRLELSEAERESLLAWRDRRDSWAGRYREDYRAQRVFEWLWTVHETMKREAERFELVLADGHLLWGGPGGYTAYPLLSQRLELHFDAQLPAFRLIEATTAPSFAANVVRLSGASATVAQTFLAKAGEGDIHPLGKGETDDFLQALVASVHSDGRFLGDLDDAPASGPVPQVWRQPMLLLRRRAGGFEAMLDAAIDHVQSGGPISDAVSALVGIHRPIGGEDALVHPLADPSGADDILLTKEANREQLEIARRLSRYGSVLVQGPPGTGKTHTIANLIGHLLAEGKSVLVTSHSTKALRVLREKVVEPLRPLCVSVLEGDAAANEQLSQAATAIANRLGSSNEEELRHEAVSLRAKRTAVIAELAKARGELLDIVRGEYKPLLVAGAQWAPIEAAREVAANAGTYGWLPGPVSGAMPLTASEVYELYETNRILDGTEVAVVEGGLPSLDDLPTPDLFAENVRVRGDVAEATAFRPSAWSPSASRDEAALEAYLSEALATFGRIASATDAELAGMLAGSEPRTREPWERLIAAITAAVTASRERELEEQLHGIALGPLTLTERDQEATLRELADHLRAGKGFGWLATLGKARWTQVRAAAKCFGRPAASAEEFEAMAAIPRERVAVAEARERWGAVLGRFDVPFPAVGRGLDTVAAEDEASRLVLALDLYEGQVTPLLRRSEELGLSLFAAVGRADHPRTAEALRDVASAITAQLADLVFAQRARLAVERLDADERAALDALDHLPGAFDPTSFVGAVRGALESRQPSSYSAAHARLADLVARSGAAQARRALLMRLEAGAVEWASQIRRRVAPHDRPEPPGDPQPAWQWKLLTQALDERARLQAGPIIALIERIGRDLRGVSSELIDRLAWAEQTARTSPDAKAALTGYVQTIRKIGRGTGRRAPELKRRAREEMSRARDAVPVWIAPLSRVAEAFDPRTTRFDVVIIDEASQLDNLGLLVWFLGDRIMVVGDDQQVTPGAVGDDLATMRALSAHISRGFRRRTSSTPKLPSMTMRGGSSKVS